MNVCVEEFAAKRLILNILLQAYIASSLALPD